MPVVVGGKGKEESGASVRSVVRDQIACQKAGVFPSDGESESAPAT